MDKAALNNIKEFAVGFVKARKKRRSDKIVTDESGEMSFSFEDECPDCCEVENEAPETEAAKKSEKNDRIGEMIAGIKSKANGILDAIEAVKADAEKEEKNTAKKSAKPQAEKDYAEEYDENYAPDDEEHIENVVNGFGKVYNAYSDIKEKSADKLKKLSKAKERAEDALSDNRKKLDELESLVSGAADKIRTGTVREISEKIDSLAKNTELSAKIGNIEKQGELADKKLEDLNAALGDIAAALSAAADTDRDTQEMLAKNLDGISAELTEIRGMYDENKKSFESVSNQNKALQEKVDEVYAATANIDKLNDSVFSLKKSQVEIKDVLSELIGSVKTAKVIAAVSLALIAAMGVLLAVVLL